MIKNATIFLENLTIYFGVYAMQVRVSSTSHLNNAGFFYASYNSLPEDRREAVDKCRNTADKFRSITAGELLVDAFVDSYPRLSRDDMGPVSAGEHGKPYLADFPDWKYNISHSGDYAVICYDDMPGRSGDIGVDIQSTRRISDGVAKKILCDEEYAAVCEACEVDSLEQAVTSPSCQSLLNALWSVKESYIKFTGIGLAFDMKKVKIDAGSVEGLMAAAGSDTRSAEGLLASYDIRLASSDASSSDVRPAYCRYFLLGGGYHLSVCSDSPNLPDAPIIVSA